MFLFVAVCPCLFVGCLPQIANMLVRLRPQHPVQFLLLSSGIASSVFSGKHIRASNRDFRLHFGVPPIVCSDVWRRGSFKKGTKPIHLLWALLWMFTYVTEKVLCRLIGVTEKTFRKWGFPLIERIAAIGTGVVSPNVIFVVLEILIT